MSEREPMDDQSLIALIDAEARGALGYNGGRLAESRKRALDYYLGNAVGELAPPEIEGRSTVISNETLATVEWMLPQLIRIFTAGDDTVEFTADHPDMEQAAQDATEYVNHVFNRQNPGFMALYSWFKDALLLKNGFLKVYWDSDETQRTERYEGLTQDDLMLLLQRNPDAQIASAEQVPNEETGEPLLTIELAFRKSKSQVRIEPIPPEEMLIRRDTKSLRDASFVAQRRAMTIAELRAMGYSDDLLAGIGSEDANMTSQEAITRRAQNDEQAINPQSFGVQTQDESTRIVHVLEAYIKVDYDGDGFPEWRMIRKAGNMLLCNEEVDGHPFVTLTPIPLPHSMFGLSMADLTREPHRIKTSIMRAMLDNLYLTVNQRFGVVDGQVNLDDLMTSRPGGIVRMKSPGAVVPLVQPQGAQAGYQLLEYMSSYQENITGWTRYSQGTTADSLNHTATGINIITNKSDQRIELIARVFAETGVTDLFRLILKLICQYQQPTEVYMGGSLKQINPTEWRDRLQLQINVGLGTGNKDQIAQHLMSVMQIQREAMQIGVADPQSIYNAATEYAKAIGFKSPEKFFSDPSKQPPAPEQPPQPQPELIKLHQQSQTDQREFSLERWKAEQEYALRWQQLEIDTAIRREELQLKYMQQAAAEAANFNQVYQQTEGLTDADEQPAPDDLGASGDGPGAAGSGDFGQPDLSGGFQPDAGQHQPGMGEQPGSGL
ncbi:hypothetical protein HQ393_04950 [Chitinibacter bivalviorum]|uniref:Portal protein n=1 Tax=Chitinibacter bivalviorum TaxID=2739434 RepID=A0A7H9BJC6_9NEIS|nr:hypothetical protein [Chitinibacter bivalviorum]QLG87654.1 hypothetical protein HQ393_04950 [Chitinibacter bivalviorum]